MRIVEHFSHLNGLEYLLVHQPGLWEEIQSVIESVDAESHRTKISREKRNEGASLYSPVEMNKAIGQAFTERGWAESRTGYWVTGNEQLIRQTMHLDPEEQKRQIEEAGEQALYTYNQTDFVKERVAVEVQLGKYSFVAFDLFVKHMSFFVADKIDLGVEILPMKEMQEHMSSGIGYYEREIYNVVRQGRGVPAVPLIIVGIAP